VSVISGTDASIASGDPTGFINNDGITIDYDSTARTITLTGDLRYSWRGQVKELTSPWVSGAHSATLDSTYFLHSTNGDDFVWSTSIWGFSDVHVSFVWHGTTDKYSIRETHGLMPWQVHEEFHGTVGSYKVSGGTLGGYVLASTTVSERRPTVSATVVKDEDIITSVAELTSSLYTKGYLTGSGVQAFTVETADIVPLSGDTPYYNQFVSPNWVQTLMSNNTYMSVWLVAVPASSDTGSQKYRYIWVQGQTAGSLLGQQALFPSDLSFGNLTSLFTEFVFCAKIILRYTSANWQIEDVIALTGTRSSFTGAPAGVFLSVVSTDDTLAGDGTAGNPLGVVNPLTTEDLANVELLDDAIKKEIDKIVASANAIDVFIYDTSRDTDGGAWVDAQLEKHRVLLFTATSTGIKAYDATDDDLPEVTLLEITLSGISSISALNGILFVGTSAGCKEYNITDGMFLKQSYATTTTPAIVNGVVNDVAMTVLPNAPIDPATGMQIPIIAVATDGGVSVITDGGDVWDITRGAGTETCDTIDFIGERLQYGNTGGIPWWNRLDIPTSDLVGEPPAGVTRYTTSTIPAILQYAADLSGDYSGSYKGLTHLIEDPDNPENGMVGYTTSSYFSGLMQGDIELCLSGEDLADKSVSATSVSGTATHSPVSTGAELEATTATSDITASVTTGGECEGWEFVSSVWEFREKIVDWVGVSESGGTITIVSGTVFTLLKYTNGAGASTSQIEFICNFEKPLFQEDAKCTFGGSSDSMVSLDYDEVTGKLELLTGDSKDTFSGALRVASEAITVGTPTCISASGGDVAHGGTTGIKLYSPAENLRTELKRVDDQNKYFGSKPVAFKFVGDTVETDFILPHGWEPTEMVYEAGLLVIEGAANEYVFTNDGFIEGVSFNVAPAAVDVVIFAVRK